MVQRQIYRDINATACDAVFGNLGLGLKRAVGMEAANVASAGLGRQLEVVKTIVWFTKQAVAEARDAR